MSKYVVREVLFQVVEEFPVPGDAGFAQFKTVPVAVGQTLMEGNCIVGPFKKQNWIPIGLEGIKGSGVPFRQSDLQDKEFVHGMLQ